MTSEEIKARRDKLARQMRQVKSIAGRMGRIAGKFETERAQHYTERQRAVEIRAMAHLILASLPSELSEQSEV